MDIEFNLTKSIEENAGKYFELAKKAKKKLEGAKKALEESKKLLHKLQQQEAQFLLLEEKKKDQLKDRHREWYEKFHWFTSSEGFLCIGGKDATSNEIIIKKHLEATDLVFHTEMAGSPFFIIKNGQEAQEITLQETAQATAIYSRAWKLGHTSADVFYVLPHQVSKEAKAGEFITKGSFMIYGKTQHIYPTLECGIGLLNGIIIGGPPTSIKAKTQNNVVVIPGTEKKSSLAKKIKNKLSGGDLNEIIKFLPAGGAEIKKERF
ncbi:DUF814 domain-containing protein [Candidatus Woesearchaeota archaeon]|nr:DUF814 domain-containing protein [Candidatus Woesearchaeota archaeon]